MPPPIVFIVPGSLETRSGGYEYDRQIVAGLRRRGWRVDVHEIAGTFPRPAPDAVAQTDRILHTISDGSLVVVDGLAFGALPEVAERHGGRVRFVSLVHLPLALDIGLDRHAVDHFRTSERRALTAASLAIVTGSTTADVLTEYAVGCDRIAVIEPGTAPARIARGSGSGDAVHLLCVAAVTRGKGHELLVQALARVPGRNWRLTCAGSLDRDRTHAAAVRNLIAAARLTDRIALAGEVDAQRLDALYDGSDVFVLATRRETYGMAVAEAIAHGLPIVATATGAIPALVGERAGVVVPCGDVEALTSALRRVIDEAGLRSTLRDGARAMRSTLRTWDEAVDRFAAALERVATDERIAR